MATKRAAAGMPRLSMSICSRCLQRLSEAKRPAPGRFQSTSTTGNTVTLTASRSLHPQSLRREYFSANGMLDQGRKNAFGSIWKDISTRDPNLEHNRNAAQSSSVTSRSYQSYHRDATVHHTTNIAQHESELLASTREQSEGDNSASVAAPSTPPTTTAHAIPLDASSRLSTRASSLPPTSLRRLLTLYLSLSKPRLTFLVVLTATSVYTLYPVPTLLLPETTTSPSLSALTLVYLTTGTALCAASANAFNMLLEPAHDAKMSRTRNRPLVRKLVSPRGALLFALGAGALGTAGLYLGVNPTVSFLGALNIFLYAGIYTPMKRFSVLNTWAGAVVGAIPPLMGWAAAAGHTASGSGGWRELLLGQPNAGGWLFAALLFAWQFPHFNALSWTIREEYKAAGYRMMAWVNPARNARVALRYSLLFFPICAGLSFFAGVTDPAFFVTSSVVNAWVVKEAVRFWRLEGKRGSARGLFWAGVWQLPALMVLAMVHKRGLWDGVWSWVFGVEDVGGFLEEDSDDEDAEWVSEKPLTMNTSGSAATGVGTTDS